MDIKIGSYVVVRFFSIQRFGEVIEVHDGDIYSINLIDLPKKSILFKKEEVVRLMKFQKGDDVIVNDSFNNWFGKRGKVNNLNQHISGEYEIELETKDIARVSEEDL